MNFISIYDESLSVTQCNEIIEYFESSNEKQTGKYNDGLFDKTIKDSIDVRKEFSDNDKVTNNLLVGIAKGLSKYKSEHPELENLDSWGLDQCFNLQKYNPGGGYFLSHCEQPSAKFPTGLRVMVWMIYLNTVTDGGETNFPQYNFKTKAKTGRLVIWPAGWTHFHHGIVSPTQTKYIATGWFNYSTDHDKNS